MSSPGKARNSVQAAFERRAARAEVLACEAPVAERPLRFAVGLYACQGQLVAAIEEAHHQRPLSGHLDRDVDRFLEPGRELFRYAAASGPEALAELARVRETEDASVARSRLLVYWGGDRAASEDYLSRAVLRPYVEVLRTAGVPPDRHHRRGHCPFCGGAPWIGARRDASQMEGSKRMLGCALCGSEWMFQRILCPSCFEEEPGRLPSFQTDAHPAVRIEACETCHRYVKSLDLSEDTRPIPEVDDLVSLSMDLWAVEQGLTRIEPGLAGL